MKINDRMVLNSMHYWFQTKIHKVADSIIVLELSHFSLYTLVGESSSDKIAAKKVALVAFAPPLKAGDFFDIVVYCVNNYDPDSTEMKVL